MSWVTYQEATTTPLKMDRKPEDDDDQYFNMTEVNNVFDDTRKYDGLEVYGPYGPDF